MENVHGIIFPGNCVMHQAIALQCYSDERYKLRSEQISNTFRNRQNLRTVYFTLCVQSIRKVCQQDIFIQLMLLSTSDIPALGYECINTIY